MKEHSIYYGKSEFYDVIRNIGGTWNDSKEHPIVCLIKMSENDNIYWAIIKNKKLLDELVRKTKRILAWENSKPNYYRQHITLYAKEL